MLRIFTIKFEHKLENFNDSILSNFLSNKEIIRWESRFFEYKKEYYWTIAVEYITVSPQSTVNTGKDGIKKDETYKEMLSEDDWPLFNRLREWRAERGKKEGVPPYIIFTNVQLAKITITRPVSLNAFQQVEGVGNAKREKYGNEVIQIIKSFGLAVKAVNDSAHHG